MATSKRCCRVCGKDISGLANRSIRCESCQKEHRLNKHKQTVKNYRRCRETRMLTNLGTTDFNAHRKKNFEAEAKDIAKEMRRLGLRE